MPDTIKYSVVFGRAARPLALSFGLFSALCSALLSFVKTVVRVEVVIVVDVFVAVVRVRVVLVLVVAVFVPVGFTDVLSVVYRHLYSVGSQTRSADESH